MNFILLATLVVVALTTTSTLAATSFIAKPFVGGSPAVPAAGALHACALLAIIDATKPSVGRLGGGTIVTRNRVLTAAHVVEGAASVRAWFYITDIAVPGNKRRTDSLWVQTMAGYDPDTRQNDLAVVLFKTNIFPLLNVIVVTKELAPTTGAAFLAGFGFTSAESTLPNTIPLLANHTVQACAAPILAQRTPTHLCALATAPAVVCPGDNGSGLYTTNSTNVNTLIGLVSIVATTCKTAAQSAFTDLGGSQIQNFLASQSIV